MLRSIAAFTSERIARYLAAAGCRGERALGVKVDTRAPGPRTKRLESTGRGQPRRNRTFRLVRPLATRFRRLRPSLCQRRTERQRPRLPSTRRPIPSETVQSSIAALSVDSTEDGRFDVIKTQRRQRTQRTRRETATAAGPESTCCRRSDRSRCRRAPWRRGAPNARPWLALESKGSSCVLKAMNWCRS
jgi:hypothetical protein